MPPFRRSAAQLRARAQEILRDGGNITNFSPAGVTRTFIDVAVDQFLEYWDALSFHAAMSVPSTATGLYLDLVGESRGVTRNLAATAIVSSDSRNVRFYTKDGVTTLASVLPSGKVPSGTSVQTSTAGITYTVTRDALVDQVQTEVFVAVVAAAAGKGSNVGRNTLVSHDLGVATVAVTNDFPIISGADDETDENYRFRISRALDRAAGATEDALRLTAFSFPEVSDIEFRPFADGVGSIEALLIPQGNEIGEDVLLGIQTVMERTAAFGTAVRVRTPSLLTVEIALQITVAPNTTSGDLAAARQGVRFSVINYIAGLRAGGTFVLNRMIQLSLDAHEAVRDLRVLVYRFRGEAHVLRNVKAESDELFGLDNTVADPVRVV